MSVSERVRAAGSCCKQTGSQREQAPGAHFSFLEDYQEFERGGETCISYNMAHFLPLKGYGKLQMILIIRSLYVNE